MATEAARLKREKPPGKKTDLTLTGLLMEGLGDRSTSRRFRKASSEPRSCGLHDGTRHCAGLPFRELWLRCLRHPHIKFQV